MGQEFTLLQAGDPSPVEVTNAGGTAPFLLVCDHAGRLVPRALGDLGVAAQDMQRHIAWDIGAGAVGKLLAERLDATLISQAYSRLVIDCNRRPGHPTSMAPVSDGTAIPGNNGLSDAARQARVDAIFAPYHACIAAELDRRSAAERPISVIALHSFTPVFGGVARPWQAGVLYNRNPGLSLALAALLRAEGMLVGNNEPYSLDDDSDYTIPVHAERRGLAYIELEIRQDLIADESRQRRWADLLAAALPKAYSHITHFRDGPAEAK